jgi:hypothetical protein
VEKRIWVFRLSVSSSGGNPQSDMCLVNTDVNYIKDKVREYKNNPTHPNEQQETTYSNEEAIENVTIDILINKLHHKGELRQGWGTSYNDIELDLNLKLDDWIANYIALDNLIWEYNSDCSDACGRYNILNLMTEMKNGDIIFVPRIPDYNSFTVATVKDGYSFEPIKVIFKKEDSFGRHGHVINVDKDTIKEFKYSDTFRPKIFNPYQRAVCEVKDGHQNYLFLKDFIDTHYR